MKPSGRRGLSFAFDLIPIGLEYIAAYIEEAVEEVSINIEENNRAAELVNNRLYSAEFGFKVKETVNPYYL